MSVNVRGVWAKWVIAVLLLAAALGCTRAEEPPQRERDVEATAAPTPAPRPAPPPMVFAVIGDYGSGDAHEQAVNNLVASWGPEFVITTGDDYYSSAGGSGLGRYGASTGAFYCKWLRDAASTGTCQGGSAEVNAFFPSLGNHDYSDARPSPSTYLDYFTLPGEGFASSSGNERYYDFIEDDVHFFVLNSNPDEPDGTSAESKQGAWLRVALSASKSIYNVVYFHHSPYSSDNVHGSTAIMQWPFAEWGADAVLSGHAHVYERLERDAIVYFVNGLGGATRYDFDSPAEGSELRYREDWGAQKVTVTRRGILFEFFNTAGTRIDRYWLPNWP